MRFEWIYTSGSQLEKLMSFLGDPDPDVRAFAGYRLADAPVVGPEAKTWLIDY
jgi:hypothetical protein